MSQHRVVQIIQGVHNASAGPTYSVARLATELHLRGSDCQVSTMGAPPQDWQWPVCLIRHDGQLTRLTGASLAQWLQLRSASSTPCILHGHGVWRGANLFPLWLPRLHPSKVVISPRGMLSEWSMQHKRWRKQPFWLTLQRPALNRAHAFHATAEIEFEDIRRLGFRQPVAIIPNGVDMPVVKDVVKSRRLVFMSRIDPKKGLEMLISIWARLAPEFNDWELVIAGPLGDSYATGIQQRGADSGAPRLHFAGRVAGETKRRLLAGAGVFVLPTYSENFGLAIAEALAHGTAVVTTTGTPWRGLDARNVGWCVEPLEAPIEEALRQAMTKPLAELVAMGLQGRQWMADGYSWVSVGEQMSATYQWLLDGGVRPDFVRID